MRHLLCNLALLFLFAVAGAAAPAVRVLQTPNDGAVPDAAVGPDGQIHITYVSGEDVFYVVSKDDGKTLTKPIRVNSEAGTAHPANMFRGPDVAVGKNGRIHVIWYVNAYQRKLPQDQWGVFYAHLDPSQKAFTKAVNLNHKPSDNYSLAADKDGNVAVVWMAGKLFVNFSNDNGVTFSAPEAISVADPCECCASRANYASNGALLIDYRDKASNIRDMHLLVRAPGSGEFLKEKISVTPWEVAGCPMTGTYLTSGKRDELVAWETKGRVLYARLDATGKRKTGEIEVAERGKWPVALAGSDGSVLISWKNESALHWQLFDASDAGWGNLKTKRARTETGTPASQLQKASTS
jgi:hypothetical protein